MLRLSVGSCQPEVFHGAGRWTSRAERRDMRGRRQFVLARLSGGDSPGQGSGMEAVKRLLGQAIREESRTKFGPLPPSDRDSGSGFINLVSREEFLAGTKEFNYASPGCSSDVSDEEVGSRNSLASAPAESPVEAETSPDVRDLADDTTEQRSGKLEADGDDGLPLRAEEKVVALGTLLLTFLALSRGSADLIPSSALEFLKIWMALAWSAHFFLGCIAFWLARQKGSNGQKQFFRILFCGVVAFDRELWEQVLPYKFFSIKDDKSSD